MKNGFAPNWQYNSSFKNSIYFLPFVNEDDGCQFVEVAVTGVHFPSVRAWDKPTSGCGVPARPISNTTIRGRQFINREAKLHKLPERAAFQKQ